MTNFYNHKVFGGKHEMSFLMLSQLIVSIKHVGLNIQPVLG